VKDSKWCGGHFTCLYPIEKNSISYICA